ncbi:MAG: PilZ domain-containing protein [Bdellovibrio sp.]|nr:MAG: PilZ domain-containing protein [Bdellovibrio sp.]
MNTNLSTPARRLPLKFEVQYRRSYSRKENKGVLKNISLTGAFLSLQDPEELQPEDKVLVRLNIEGRERVLQATVIWKNPEGCGLHFKPFNNRDIQIVDDLMYFIENSRDNKKSILNTILQKL